MPRIKQWLPFFEQASQGRGIKDWYAPIEKVLQSFGLKVRHLVSDRAKALIQLGSPSYLNICSMPDLFHFNQTLAQQVGTLVGKAWSKTMKAYKSKNPSGACPDEMRNLEYSYMLRDVHRRLYRKGIEGIHQALHAFQSCGKLMETEQIEKAIRKSIGIIDDALMQYKAANRAAANNRAKANNPKDKTVQQVNSGEPIPPTDSLDLKHIEKLFNQIPDLLAGIQQWQQWTLERTKKFVEEIYKNDTFQNFSTKEKCQKYLLHVLLPVFYWQLIYRRVPAKQKNQVLRQYYKNQMEYSLKKYQQHPLSSQFSDEELQKYEQWAIHIARSFQRASSQVEGRNGYLAFVHRANRGLSQQRLQVLTIVHNFDIRGYDNKTPAQRLFQRNFPDLFEFILKNVTPFPEPRLRRSKSICYEAVRD